ncbi:MAG: Ig-like domain-containing protein [Vulcanimicrobiota bacterium]
MSLFKHLHFLLLLILSTLLVTGCGSDQDYVFTNNASGSETTTIRLEQTLLRAVPSAVTHQRFSGYNSAERLIYGPETREKDNPIILQRVPVAVSQLQIEYLVGQTVVGTITLPVSLQPGVTFTIQDPEFEAVLDSLQSLSVSPTATLAGIDETRQFTAIGTFAGEAELEITEQVSWSSSQPSIAEIDPVTGLALAKSAGIATITATANGLSAEATMEVITETITGLTIDPPAALSAPGTTRSFTATIQLSGGSSRDATEMVNWSSDNTSVEIGEFSGLAAIALEAATPSSAIITASLGEQFQKTATLNLGSYLYLSGDGGVLGFRINPDNGALTDRTLFAVSPSAMDVVVDPSGRFAYSAGLKTRAYEINPGTGALTLIEEENVDSLQLAVHPSGRFLYSIRFDPLLTPSGVASAFSIDQENGALELINSVSIPESFLLSDLAIHPSGRMLYVSQTVDPGELHFLTISPENGSITYNTFQTLVEEINELAVEPLGRFLYATGVAVGVGNDEIVFRVPLDAASGAQSGPLNSFDLGYSTLPKGGSTFHPSRPVVYIGVDENLTVQSIDANGQIIEEVDKYEDVQGVPMVAVDPSGRFIFWGFNNVPHTEGIRGVIEEDGSITSTASFSYEDSFSTTLSGIAVTP